MSDIIGYVAVDELRDYAAGAGVDLTDKGDDELAVMLTRAVRFIDAKDAELIGRRTERDQEHAYPRTGLVINGWTYGDDEIAEIVKQCQMEFALDLNAGIAIETYAPTQQIVEKTVVGVVSVKYSDPKTGEVSERKALSMSLLAQLTKQPTGGGGYHNVRLERS